MTSFSVLTLASALHDPPTVARLTAGVLGQLASLGGEPVDEPETRPDRPLVILVGTGGTEAAVLAATDRRRRVVPFEPVILVAHPRHNSLPAALEAMARLRRDGVRGRIVQVTDDGTDRLAEVVADVTAIHRVRATTIGLVGEPSGWLVASVPDPDLLRAKWGIDVRPLPISTVIEAQRKAPADAVRSVAVRFGRAGTHDDEIDHHEIDHQEIDHQEIDRAAALHPALLETIGSYEVDAVAVRCFDFITDLGTSGCVALAELNDAGIVAGCEGDVASTVAMVVVRALLDQPSWIANPARVDLARNTVLLAHCTVAPSMVEDLELHTHFESGRGIGLRGRFAQGPVTLLRLGGEALERYWVAEGELVGNGADEDLCRTQVMVQLDDGDVGTLLEDPLGNHVLMILGRHADHLRSWWQLAFG